MRSESPIRARGVDLPWAGLAALGVVIYVLIDVALAFLRPDLSLIHNAESDYGNGPYSWLMDINFLLRGALTFCLAAAIAKRWRPSTRARWGLILLVGWGVFSALLAFFPDNPPGTPHTASGGIHLLFAFIAFFCALIGTIVLSIRVDYLPALEGARNWLLTLSVLAVLPILALGRSGFLASSPGGLFERIFLALELAWILFAAVRLALVQRTAKPGEVSAAS